MYGVYGKAYHTTFMEENCVTSIFSIEIFLRKTILNSLLGQTALDMRTIFCLYVSGFQRQVFKHVVDSTYKISLDSAYKYL